MDEQQLQAIEARWAKATPGPWGYDGMHNEITCSHGDEYWLLCSELRTHPNEKISDEFGHAYNPNFEAIASAPTDIALLLAEVRRLQLAEKVCKLMQKNRGGHYCVVSKCDNCHTEEVGNAGEVCWTCIEKALKEWEAAGNG